MPGNNGRDRSQRTQPVPNPCPWWDQFPDFVPNPDAGFRSRFDKLANMQAWTARERQQCKVEALEAHLAMGTEGQSKLDIYRELCVEVGVVPGESITKCKKALKSVYINLVNLIDTRCNPKIPLLPFDTYAAFQKYTCKPKAGRKVPRDLVKKGGFVDAFLRELNGSGGRRRGGGDVARGGENHGRDENDAGGDENDGGVDLAGREWGTWTPVEARSDSGEYVVL